jgi:UDP-3-O-acyl-N-acetylglucosamine deacetylase
MARKTTDSPAARGIAAEFISDASDAGIDNSDAGKIVSVFEAVEVETHTVKVGGRPVDLQRVVLTGPWEPVRK